MTGWCSRRFLGDVAAMTKPVIGVMVVMTTVVGFVLAADGGGRGAELLAACVGVLLVASSSSVFNQVIERDSDARMRRTADRPLPAGRFTRAGASVLGVVLGALGTATLLAGTNLLTAALAVATHLWYVLVYTPLKRRTSINTIVGAIPGAMPPVLGWTAASGRLEPGALALFAILFLWQLPHFLSIAWLYREEYARGGFRMLSLHDESGLLTGRQMMLHCTGLVLVSFLPFFLEIGGPVYLAGAQVAGAIFLASTVGFWWLRTRGAAHVVLRASLLYLPGLFGLLAMGR